MHGFIIRSNPPYLSRDIKAFYHTDYVGYRRPENPDYINTLKNTFNSCPASILTSAVQELNNILLIDLPQLLRVLNLNSLTVCVVPRAKTHYHQNQLLFKSTIRNVVNQLNGFCDGIDYISRHTNTQTTHLRTNIPNFDNDGHAPYPGITNETCNISSNVKDKNTLLIDDIYTKTVNIDEDAIQALLDKGARSVTFYAVGRTVHNRF